jgi:Ca2+-dependent lipid-binding protein
MDPYLNILHDGHTYKTKVIKKGGKTPVWNETFDIPIDGLNDKIKIKCYDEDLIMDDFVGEGEYSASTLCPLDNGAVHKDWFVLKYDSKKAAEILLET